MPDPALNPTHGLLPNPLAWIGSHPVAYPALEVVHLIGIVAGLAAGVLISQVVARYMRAAQDRERRLMQEFESAAARLESLRAELTDLSTSDSAR